MIEIINQAAVVTIHRANALGTFRAMRAHLEQIRSAGYLIIIKREH